MLDDSQLITGMDSKTTQQVAQVRKKIKQDRQVEASQVLPAADIILQYLEDESSRMESIDNLDIAKMTADELMIEVQARKAYRGYLSNLDNRIKGLLKEARGE